MKIVIIGAGIAGLSIGWRLAQSGAAVTVLERAQPGRGATWASAGMISATAEVGEADSPETRFAHHSALLWPHFAREVEEESGLNVDYLADGALIAATTSDEAAMLSLRAKGSAGLEFLVRDAARSLEPMLADSIEGALFDPSEAQVDNRALGPALAIALQRAGGILQTNEPVVRMECENGRAVAAQTPFRTHRADAFVLSAGAWSAQIEGLPREAVPPVNPVKGEMIALASKKDALPRHVVWGNGVYLVPRGDRLLVGATVADQGFDTRTTDEAGQWLDSRAVGLMPQLENWPVVEQWAGLRPGSPDGLPLIGPSHIENLFVASGQFRNGILFAPAIADSMRRLVLEGEAATAAFDPRRFC